MKSIIITIMQFERNGVKDTDKSYHISENLDNLEKLTKKDYSEMLESKIEEYVFSEKRRGMNGNNKTFPAIKMGDWYFIWIDTIKHWIAVYLSVKLSPDRHCSLFTIDITITKGPYSIGKIGAGIIKENVYKSDVPEEKIETTSPEELKSALYSTKIC